MADRAQRRFSGGEITPALYAGTDLQKHATGLRTLRNGYVMRHGGQINRPGSKFICELYDSSEKARLASFVDLDGNKYVYALCTDGILSISDESISASVTGQSITDISNANPALVYYSGADNFSAGQMIVISGVAGDLGKKVNGRQFRVGTVNTGSNYFQLKYMDGSAVDSSAWAAYSSGGTAKIVFGPSPAWAEEDLPDLQFLRAVFNYTFYTAYSSNPGAGLLVCHQNYEPYIYGYNETYRISEPLGSTGRPSSVTNSGTTGSARRWEVTAVFSNGYESRPSASTGANAVPTAGSPITVSWSDTYCDTAVSYNVYSEVNGVYGFLGTAIGTSFVDNGYTPNFDIQPPYVRDVFGTDDYPGVVGAFQQRIVMGNTPNYPTRAFGSIVGNPFYFTYHSPLEDTDSFLFELVKGEIRHILDIGRPVILTSEGEWSLEGGGGLITPTDIGPRQFTAYGSSKVAPVVIGNSAIYVQARGSALRDIGFDYSVDGYAGNDLTLFAAHLFDGFQITRLAYQHIPHSLVYAIRNDGKILCLTYVKNQEILAWSHWDTAGEYEDLCSFPGDTEDEIYAIVKRTINGTTKRYIEKFTTRTFTDIKDLVLVDCAKTVDGRNTNTSHTMTLSDGTDWDIDETLTLTSSTSYFTSADVGKEIHLEGSDGSIVRFTIVAYTSGTVVTGTCDRTVPDSLQDTATADWAIAISEVNGLWHLEGEDVAIQADGFVVASPNNPAYQTYTVANGTVTLDRCYTVIHVGLPYISDMETLDVDTPQGPSLADKHMIVRSVNMQVEKTRGLWVGPKPPSDDDTDPLEGLVEVKQRTEADGYDSAISLETEKVEVAIPGEWNSHGRIFIRQVDPLPMSILAIRPDMIIPGGG